MTKTTDWREIKGTQLHRDDVRKQLKMDEERLPNVALSDDFMDKLAYYVNKTAIQQGFWNSLEVALEHAQDDFGLDFGEINNQCTHCGSYETEKRSTTIVETQSIKDEKITYICNECNKRYSVVS